MCLCVCVHMMRALFVFLCVVRLYVCINWMECVYEIEIVVLQKHYVANVNAHMPILQLNTYGFRWQTAYWWFLLIKYFVILYTHNFPCAKVKKR